MEDVRKIQNSSLLAWVALGWLVLGSPGFAEQPERVADASASKTVQITGAPVPYDVSFSELALKDAAGAPQATISALSYIRSGPGDRAHRPVLFAWGGGPGGSSQQLAFSLGPKLARASEQPSLSNNPGTVLDVADIVIIDAVGTGLSRALTKAGGKAYWGVNGDEKATELLIRDWLRVHHRLSSPVYLAGVSYGGFRLGKLAEHVADLNIAGFIAISGGLNLSQQAGDLSAISSDPAWIGGIDIDQSFVVNLPTMAAAAFAHHKGSDPRMTVEQVFETARRFAQGEYAQALQQGAELAPATRDRLAQTLSKMIGLPVSDIAGANLRVQSQDFLDKLVSGSVVSRLDTRVAAQAPTTSSVPGRIRAADDPSLQMIGTSLKTSKWVKDYLENEVGVRTSLDYVTLSLEINEAWNWNSGSEALEANIVGLDATPSIAKTMRDKPDSRLLVISGYYDLAVPALAQRYAVLHAGIPLDRTTIATYKAGHEVLEDPDTLPRLQEELHRFILGRNDPRLGRRAE